MFDKNCLLVDGTLSATGGQTAKDLGPDLVPRTYGAHLPVAGTTITLALEESPDNTNWHEVGRWHVDGANTSAITAAGMYYLTAKCNERYRRVNVIAITGSFTGAQIGPMPAGRDDSY